MPVYGCSAVFLYYSGTSLLSFNIGFELVTGYVLVQIDTHFKRG